MTLGMARVGISMRANFGPSTLSLASFRQKHIKQLVHTWSKTNWRIAVQKMFNTKAVCNVPMIPTLMDRDKDQTVHEVEQTRITVFHVTTETRSI